MFKKTALLVMLSFVLVSSASAMTTVEFTASNFYNIIILDGSQPPDDTITGRIVYDTLGSLPFGNPVVSVDLTIDNYTYTASEVGGAYYDNTVFLGGVICDVSCMGGSTNDFWLNFDSSTNQPISFAYGVQGSNGAFYTEDISLSITSTSVPEPTTMLLFGAGLAGLGIMRKRFKG